MPTPILATKVFIPSLRPNVVPRPRLIARLNEGLQAGRKLALISAPAGYGKTSMLSAWIPQSSRRIAWLALDEGDNDPIRFWTYVIAALQRLHVDLGGNAQALLRAQEPEPQRIQTFLALLINELAAFPEEFALVLDDYHLINNTAIHEGIAYLLDYLPAQVHLIVASQADPPLPLARWRARSELTEIRADDLRFTPEEATTFLNQVMGLQLSASDASALEERTEGWIAGLQLAALSLQGRTDARDFIAAFTGGHHYIIDYLTEQVLKRQPQAVQSFLLGTCLLDQLCGDLCDAVTDQHNGQAMLEHLEQANLFTICLDDKRQWYRYHHLFAEVLQLKLQQTEPALVPKLHQKASSWYEQHQRIDDAVRHALAAGDKEWGALLVEQHLDDVLRRGEGVTLRRWLAALLPEVVRARPRLALAQALVAFNVSHLDVVEPLLADAESALTTTPKEQYAPPIGDEDSAFANIPATIALVRASLAGYRGDAERMSELARLALTHLSENEQGPRYSVLWNLALADWMRGRLADAERAFADLVSKGRARGELHLTLSAGLLLGQVQRAQGRLSAALLTYQEGLEFVARMGSALAPSAGMAHLGIAQVLYERNQLEQALRHATESITLGRQLTSLQALANGLTILAWIRQAMGDSTGSRAAMEEAYQLMPNQEIIALQNPVPTERVRLFLAQGDPSASSGQALEAARWLEQRGLKVEDEPSYSKEREYLLLVRVLLARNESDKALGLVEQLCARAEEEGRIESLMEARVLQSLVLNAIGEQPQAMLALTRALELAEPEGYIRLFVDEGVPMLRLLRQAESRGVVPAYVAQLLAAFGESALHAAQTGSFLAEPLSARELEILRLVAAGLTTQEISEQLVIAVGTVRTHLKNIFGKLDAHSRLQAVERAHALKLL